MLRSILFLFLLISGCARHTPPNQPLGSAAIVGAATLKCSEIIASEALFKEYIGWIYGYASGINEILAQSKSGLWDITAPMSRDNMEKVVLNYCKKFPNDDGQQLSDLILEKLTNSAIEKSARDNPSKINQGFSDNILGFLLSRSFSRKASSSNTAIPYIPGEPVIDRFGRPSKFVPNDGGGGTPLGPITPNAYGPGVHMDATGRPVQAVPWP